MAKLHCNIRLRPTRIAFLVHPNDKASLRKIAQTNTTLWGGIYNPIIPIFGKIPKEWKTIPNSPASPSEIIDNYIKYYEPEIFVETREGQINKTKIIPLTNNMNGSNVIAIDKMYENEFRGVYEPCVGQHSLDIINHIYETERKFQLKNEEPSIYGTTKTNLIWDIIAGSYPAQNQHKLLFDSYKSVFDPEFENNKILSKESWLKIFGRECITPINLTKYKIDINSASEKPNLFIFNPDSAIDLIELWNTRTEHNIFFPIPVNFIEDLLPRSKKYIMAVYSLNKESNIKHRCTIQTTNSLSTDQKLIKKIKDHLKDIPNEAFILERPNQPILEAQGLSGSHSNIRLEISSKNNLQELDIKEDDSAYTEIEALNPEFADDISSSKFRWANVISFSALVHDSQTALTLPFNTYDHNWPFDSFDTAVITSEGWVFSEQFYSKNKRINLITQSEAFKTYFDKKKIKFEPSEAGRIAKQMVESLGGLSGLNLLLDPDLIKFINKVAASSKTKSLTSKGTIQEQYPEKTATKHQWERVISNKNKRSNLNKYSLEDYVKKKIVKIGLETICTNCYAKNWHPLDEISYKNKCVRCLGYYDFPQGNQTKNNGVWKYRVIGPFAVPDYAQGAYGALLTIRFFAFLQLPYSKPTYSTAAELTYNGEVCEVDFLLWSEENSSLWRRSNPTLILGEAKSFANSAITEKDIVQIKKAASLNPGCAISISVLKDSFSRSEKQILKNLLKWTRKSKNEGPKHWLIILTGTELFSKHLPTTWKKKGGMHEKLAGRISRGNLQELSDATIQLYLNEPDYLEWSKEKN